MRYPTLPNDGFLAQVTAKLEDPDATMTASPTWQGTGSDFPVGSLASAAVAFKMAIAGDGKVDPDAVEAKMAAALHPLLRILPVEALDDAGLWRYLSLGALWPYVRWREPGAFDSGEPVRFLKYVDGRSPAECVLMRTYIRGSIALATSGHAGDYSLAGKVPKATDLWRSHIVRVRTSTAPTIARALVDSQAAHRMPTDELREVARELNRTWTNVVLHVYDDSEADELIEELRRQ